ncbi:MAG: hypothetical protein LDL41_13715 [Coleofasciculus sp. S288]|nr:hypothetical protein [Coleofasciculus sp. S288]
MLYLTLKDSVVELGKSVTGQVTWQSSQPSQPLTVKLGWHTEGRGSKQKQTVVTLELGQLSASDVRSFQCHLPREVPVSFDGKLFRVIWELRAEVRVGILGSKKQTVPIRVIPRRSQL